MSRKCLASIACTVCIALAAPAFAQTSAGGASGAADVSAGGGASGAADVSAGGGAGAGGAATGGPLTSDEAAAQISGSAGVQGGAAGAVDDDASLLLERRTAEMSLGWRAWVMHVPRFIVNMFAHIEPGWNGGTGIATGPEFVYRNNGLDIAIGAMYVNYNSEPGYFHGTNEGPTATEQVRSNLFGLYLTSHFMYGFRFHRMFEFQAGAGIGVGYIGGDLHRVQAYQDASGMYQPCRGPGDPNAQYCDGSNNHYGNYTEPSIFSGGSVPSIIPWISLPQVAFHVRPHRNIDFKLEGGFALIGFYGGLSAHYVF